MRTLFVGMTVMLALLIAPLSSAGASEPKFRHAGCHTYRCDNRMDRKAHAKTVKRWQKVVAPLNSYLMKIARCESNLRWHIDTGNGFLGGLQFTKSSWLSVGGKRWRLPHQASPLEQKFRAVLLSRVQGWRAWPVCSR